MCQTKEKILYFNILPTMVRNGGPVKVDRFCNGFEAVNIGAIAAEVNGIPLNPPAAGEVLGDSYLFSGLKGEIFMGKIYVSFPGGGVGGIVVINQKVYNPDFDNGIEEALNKNGK